MTSKQTELEKLAQIQSVALDALSGVVDLDALEAWRVTHLGRSSAVMAVFSSMGSIDKELRPLMGKAANEVRQALEAALEEKRQTLEAVALKQSLEVEKLDITLPGRPVTRGRLHP